MKCEEIRVLAELLNHAATRVVETDARECDCALSYLEGVLVAILAIARPKELGSPNKVSIPKKLFGFIPINRKETRREFAIRKAGELMTWLEDRM